MTHNPSPIISRAARELSDVVAKTLADAFVKDPIFNWFMRTDGRRDAARYKMFKAIVDLLGFDECQIEIIENGAGVAVWVPYPGELNPPLSKEIKALPALVGASGLARLHRMVKMRATIKRYKENSPHTYLWFLGVTPQSQGKGLGGKLLDACLTKIDEQGLVAALETATQSNVAFYQSRGFELVHEFQIDDTAPKVWTMRRAARQK